MIINMVYILISIIWILLGLWICEKREWYKHIEKDFQSTACCIAIVFSPLNLIFVLIREFVVHKWDNNI